MSPARAQVVRRACSLLLLLLASVAALRGQPARANVANFNSNSVSVIDTSTNAVVATVAVGDSPPGAAASEDGSRVFVANLNSNSVSVIDTSTNTVTATVTVGDSPVAVAVSEDGSRAYVVNQGPDTVSVIDTSTNTVIATVTVGDFPFSLGDFVGPGPVPVELQRFAVE